MKIATIRFTYTGRALGVYRGALAGYLRTLARSNIMKIATIRLTNTGNPLGVYKGTLSKGDHITIRPPISPEFAAEVTRVIYADNDVTIFEFTRRKK